VPDETSSGLGYEVFIADPIPLNVGVPVPNGDRRMFSPLSITLIHGRTNAVLVDPPMTTDHAQEVGDWIESAGKNLTHIFATHGHGDHWFTAGLLAARFDATVVASAGTIAQMRRNVEIRPTFWDPLLPGQIPDAPVTAVTVPENRFELEGHELVIIEVGHSDTDETSVLHVPDLAFVAAGDVIYNGVHQYLVESKNGGLQAWSRAIDAVAALQPRWIVAGHKNKEFDDRADRQIAETRHYLDTVAELLPKFDNALDFFNEMLDRFPDRVNPGALWGGAQALFRQEP